MPKNWRVTVVPWVVVRALVVARSPAPLATAPPGWATSASTVAPAATAPIHATRPLLPELLRTNPPFGRCLYLPANGT